jgi:hypothetical protein
MYRVTYPMMMMVGVCVCELVGDAIVAVLYEQPNLSRLCVYLSFFSRVRRTEALYQG